MSGIAIKPIELIEIKLSKPFHKYVDLDLPDLYFFQWCHRNYQLNKGVYNTIDHWFYEKGIVSITKRRKMIVAFLDDAKNEGSETKHHNVIRFGHGGLTTKLIHFFSRHNS